jgi:hypothetical protein
MLTPQQQQNVIEAGRGAYRMLIDVSGNPHSKQPHRDLWDKGWRLERKKDEAKNNPRGAQNFAGRDSKTFRPRANNSNSPRPATGFSRQVEDTTRAVNTDRFVQRFNTKFQTRTA